MDQKPFSIVAGLIFTLVALFHLVRIYMGWPVDIGDYHGFMPPPCGRATNSLSFLLARIWRGLA